MRVLALLVVSVALAGARLVAAPATASAATLEQCRAELQADQPVELRRRAVLVAGKYLVPAASELLGQCLLDPDAVVRRNALVSIGEEAFHLRANRVGVLQCLRDDDVNIRRLASSLLDEVLRGLRVVRPEQAAELPPEQVAAFLNAALADEDAEVRRNVLATLQDVPVALSGAALAPFLEESASSTVILAITPYLMSDADAAAKCAALRPLASRPEREVRLALAEALAASAPSPEFEALFRTLAQDELPEVRSCALAALLPMAPADDTLVAAVRQLLTDAGVAAESRVRLVEALRGFPPQRAWALLGPLLDRSQPEPVRLAVWQQLLFRKELQEELATGRLLGDFAGESSAALRRIQLSVLRRRQDALSSDDLARLQESAFADVRRSALSLSGKLSEDERIELIFSALLDEDESVRLEAVRLVASLRPPEWKQLLCDSLEESGEVASAAARGLLPVAKSDAQVAAALRRYLPRCRDASLRRQLQERVLKNSPN